MRTLRYILRRLLFVFPQVIGISLVTFLIVRVLPANPAFVIAGPSASPEAIKAIEERLGLSDPLWTQYYEYIKNVLQGDFGTSFVTGQTVTADIADRLPATLELVILGLALAVLIGIPIGIASALSRNRFVTRGSTGYGLLAGAIPDFWLGLIMIFLFYYLLGIAPAPLGQIGADVAEPTRVTGAVFIDSLLTGNLAALKSSASHLVLPLATLVFVYAAPIVKMTRESVEDVYFRADFIEQAHANGLSQRAIVLKALRNGLPSVITLVGVLFGFLFGGAVLIETVFSWGGFGQYAVQAIVNSDFNAVQAFVICAAIFNLIVYLIVDLLYFVVDPRLRTRR